LIYLFWEFLVNQVKSASTTLFFSTSLLLMSGSYLLGRISSGSRKTSSVSRYRYERCYQHWFAYPKQHARTAELFIAMRFEFLQFFSVVSWS
jgi:hypothetical protein